MIRARRYAPIVALALAGCGAKPPAGTLERGIASWYGHPFDGRQTASGEIYNMEKLTAAHRTLPFGAVVRVRNLGNEKAVEVRINDRGPFEKGRVIDLSHRAAGQIEMPGVANVELQPVRIPKSRAPDEFAVQVGLFEDEARARRTRDELEKEYGHARTVLRDGDPPVWRVLVGSEPAVEGAGSLARRLEGRFGSVFVVRADAPP